MFCICPGQREHLGCIQLHYISIMSLLLVKIANVFNSTNSDISKNWIFTTRTKTKSSVTWKYFCVSGTKMIRGCFGVWCLQVRAVRGIWNATSICLISSCLLPSTAGRMAGLGSIGQQHMSSEQYLSAIFLFLSDTKPFCSNFGSWYFPECWFLSPLSWYYNEPESLCYMQGFFVKYFFCCLRPPAHSFNLDELLSFSLPARALIFSKLDNWIFFLLSSEGIMGI